MAEKILIVDDDLDSLKLISLMLKRHNFDVVLADAGQKALSIAENELPSLIILDVMMPDMNGLEVARRLRAGDNTKDIPIIMFTAKTLIDDKVKGFEAGADDYLTKPTHPAELASRVKAILARKATKKQNNTNQSKASNIRNGLVMGVLGAKGGVGTTTLALNVGAALLRTGAEVIVADYQLGNGGLGRMIGVTSHGMARCLMSETINIDSVESEIVEHQSGLRTLLSSSNPREFHLSFSPEKAVQVLDTLSRMGDPVIVDMGTGLPVLNSQLLQRLDKLIFVVAANSVALDIANDHLAEIENAIGAAKVNIVVVNLSQSTLSWHDVENALQREVKAIISAAPELAHQALENQQPMVMLQPNAMISGQYAKLAEEINVRNPSLKNS